MSSLPKPVVFTVLLTALSLTSIALAQGPGDRGGRRGWGRRRPPSAVLTALDQDQDEALSAEEIAGATKALLTLDQNEDGNLTLEELRPPREGRRGRRGFGGPPGMGHMDPLVAALDKDRDAELFEDEVTDAAISLRKLDSDGDGALSSEELRPRLGRGGPGGFRGPGGRGPGGFRGPGGGEEREGETPEPSELDPKDGAAEIPDRAKFEEFAYQGQEVMVDTHLAGLQFVKFQIEGAGRDDAKLYFMNTKTHRAHPAFMRAIGLDHRASGRMRGVLVYWPLLEAPNGESGLYTYEFEPNDAFPFEMIQIAHGLLEKHSALLRDRLAYNLLTRAKEVYLTETEKYEAAELPVFESKDRYASIRYLPLHEGESYGRLRLMGVDDLPSPRDIVLCTALPNEMPRVAGVVSAVRQTPLSHVNLRAIQDDIPNAYIADAAQKKAITALIGKAVYYRVSADGFELREATDEEIDSHFSDLRPAKTQTPDRDLSVQTIRRLTEIGFDDAKSVGVKAANLGVLRSMGFREGLTPRGFAIPFSFYVEFMKHNGFDVMATKMMADRDFVSSAKTREQSLKQFRKAIKKGKMPAAMTEALTAVQRQFPEGTSIRARSSTNNEDLPGFSGAGLYDSYTHHPNEGHLSKSVKQVFASLWNFRAYEEREFYRIDHHATAMGVVLHPNTDNERANGVAVTQDILYRTEEQSGPRFYVNAQVGEDLVTNPETGSTPEELLIGPRNPRSDQWIRYSSAKQQGESVLDATQLLELRRALRKIHEHFRQLYGVAEDEPEFAMEVEFKVLADGSLFIKQARPWVFH